jgi:hypothetical protein
LWPRHPLKHHRRLRPLPGIQLTRVNGAPPKMSFLPTHP